MSRIPLALQAVFLASNRGQEVHKPPPGRLGDRVFAFQPTAARTWFWQKRNVNKHANSTPPETSTPPRGRSHRWSTSKKEKRHNAAAAAQLPTTPTTMKCNLETASQSSSPVMDIYVPATDSSIQLGGGSPKKATKKGSSRLRKSSSRPVVERADSTTSSVTFHTTLVQKKNVQSTVCIVVCRVV